MSVILDSASVILETNVHYLVHIIKHINATARNIADNAININTKDMNTDIISGYLKRIKNDAKENAKLYKIVINF